jgi:competence ComEA-like helix-hairpin-helix protein
MWKDFFYYSRSERRAVYFLLFLIALLLVAIIFYSKRDNASSDLVENSAEVDSFLADVKKVNEHSAKESKDDCSDAHITGLFFEFDPNLADSIELSRLGLPSYVVKNVLKYRAKGGRFKTSASFSKIYGLTPELFAELEPYIRIPEQLSTRKRKQVFPKTDSIRIESHQQPSDKYSEGTKVNVNIADTIELKKIPGIGSVIARNIVAYRQRLGGFYDLEQLLEVRFFTPELLEWFVLGDTPMKQIKVNHESLDNLRAHPYLNFYQAKIIVEHRKKRGEIKSLSQLSLYEEFTEKDLKRLSAYFNFD